MNKIAIVIPIYNVEKYLDECLRSCLLQDYENYEIVLVNDGSRDNSFEIAKKYALDYDFITLIDKENIGLGSARNAGLMYLHGFFDEFLNKNYHDTMQEYKITCENPEKVKRIYSHAANLSKSTWVMFLDSDDYLMLDTLKHSADFMQDSDILCFDEKVFVDEGGCDLKGEISYLEFFNIKNNVYFNTNQLINHIVSNNRYSFWWGRHGMIRLDFLKEHNLYYIPEIYHEDNAFGLSLLLFANKFAFLNEKLYAYRLRAGSIMNRTNIVDTSTLSHSMKFLYEEFSNDLAAAREYFKNYSFVKIANFIHENVQKCTKPEWIKNTFIRQFYSILIEDSNKGFSSILDPLGIRKNYAHIQNEILRTYAKTVKETQINTENQVEKQTIKYFLNITNIARITMFINGLFEKLDIKTSQQISINYPEWFKNASGEGIDIFTQNPKDTHICFSFIAPLDSTLAIDFRGNYILGKNSNSPLPIYIQYKNITINSKNYGDFAATNQNPKTINLPCKKDEKIEVSFSIDTYKYTLEELQELLKEIYAIEDEMILKLIYAYVNMRF